MVVGCGSEPDAVLLVRLYMLVFRPTSRHELNILIISNHTFAAQLDSKCTWDCKHAARLIWIVVPWNLTSKTYRGKSCPFVSSQSSKEISPTRFVSRNLVGTWMPFFPPWQLGILLHDSDSYLLSPGSERVPLNQHRVHVSVIIYDHLKLFRHTITMW